MKDSFLSVPVCVWRDKKLIASLAKNDFKNRFAGSYLGIFWAFVQPVVTIVLYWFVFEKALHAGASGLRDGIPIPFVLWLIAGLVPWFYFQEALGTGTSAFLEYNFLVKKVVFNISILPVVKIVSGLFVHIFFLLFMLVMYTALGFFPPIYALPLFYYSFCMICFVTGLVYATSAIVIFFRDLSQIINISMQVLMWATPIMWDINAFDPGSIIVKILRLNPMFYVIQGFRDSMIYDVWFFERPGMTAYFWCVTLVCFLIGTTVFRKLKTHFADVL